MEERNHSNNRSHLFDFVPSLCCNFAYSPFGAQSLLQALASSRKEQAAEASRAHIWRVMEDRPIAVEDRVPLSDVVSDCVRRWFRDTLEEAKVGDVTMQVLVGQMYRNGYGVPRNEQKANAWFTKASRCRSSVWKVCEKRPGYNASDSDTDETSMDMN